MIPAFFILVRDQMGDTYMGKYPLIFSSHGTPVRQFFLKITTELEDAAKIDGWAAMPASLGVCAAVQTGDLAPLEEFCLLVSLE